MGTPAYLAREQREGKPYDARTDIYSLGLVLSEMATGKRCPAGGKPDLHELPAELARLLDRCVDVDPDDRWRSAADLRIALGWVAQETAARAAPKGRSRRRAFG